MARQRSCFAPLIRHCHVSSSQTLASLGFLCSTFVDILEGPLTLSRVRGIIQRNYFPGTAGRVTASASASQSQQSRAESTNGGAAKPSDVDGPWLIVGLGNPGSRYEWTRHNIGFELVDTLAREECISMTTVQCKAAIGKGRICGVPVVLAKPQTFMNCSGESVAPLAKFYKIPKAKTLVMYDDLDLDVASMKLLAKGGHGGHNGMRSIIDKFAGDKNFPRLRFGIGRPPGKMPTAAYVLHKFTKDEREEVDISISRAVEGVRMVLSQGLDRTVSQWNQSKKQPARV